LLIGANNLAEEFFKYQKNNPEYQIVGYLAAHPNPKIRSKYLGNLDHLETIVQNQKIDHIIQTNSEIPQIESLHLIDFCQSEHIQYSFIPSNLEVQRSNLEIETSAGMPIIKIKTTPIDGWNRLLKRIFDICGALAGLILFSIPMAIIAIAIKIDSKGPIIFCRKDDGSPVYRIGQYGKKIRFYKFRTMKPNTDSLRYKELAAQNIRKDSPLVKIKDDPRITKLGRFLRKTSLDELPQFWSVLIGDLSLVGPRPHLPEEVAKYQKHQHFVLNIKPGITGLAQISGRSDLSFDEEVRLDRYYIENWSLWKDIKILLKTLLVPFRGYSE
jgi:exopolysaccharide biosynthesis polyprenyl glycosylphosphotransferase